MERETTLSDYDRNQLSATKSEYVFDTYEFAQGFVAEWKDKIGVDEIIWANDDGTFSVIVNARG